MEEVPGLAFLFIPAGQRVYQPCHVDREAKLAHRVLQQTLAGSVLVYQCLSLAEAQAKIDAWRQDYNQRGPTAHSGT